MTDGFSIIKITDITKPATVLIEKISDAFGGYFKPFQIRRVAKAEAEADLIKEQAQIEKTDLHHRSLIRFITEEAKKQDNIESITERAIPHLIDTATPQEMENDWITNFFDKCRIVSDEEMQLLWAKILAGEANSPGTYSKRTVNFLGSLDKLEARLFTNLCSFNWVIRGLQEPLIFNSDDSIFRDLDLNFGSLTHLDAIGLISFSRRPGYKLLHFPKRFPFSYYGTVVILEFKEHDNNEFHSGEVLLTSIGRELARVCIPKLIDGFIDYVIKKLSEQGIVLFSPYPRQHYKSFDYRRFSQVWEQQEWEP